VKNLLIIMADELRHDIVLHERYPFVPLPALDRLRREGITAQNCFSQFPVSCPSRASFITGKYPHQISVWSNALRLPAVERDLGHHLSAHGYDAVAFGKTHNTNPGFRSIAYDLKTAIGFNNHGYDVDSERITGVYEGPEEEYCDFVACRQFDEYVRGRGPRDKPFAAFIGIYAPHPPLYPPKRFAAMFDPEAIDLPEVPPSEGDDRPAIQADTRRKWLQHPPAAQRRIVAHYLGMCALVDACVDRLLQTLAATGQLEETIVVFTADHGEQLGDHNMVGKFYNNYEGALRAPLILRLPHQAHAGGEMPQLIEMLDVYPTVCELLDVPFPTAPHALAGRSFTPAFGDPAHPHRQYVHSMIETAQMVRTDRWKLVFHPDDRCELYDLASDPGETRNCYADPACEAVRRELQDEILRHLIRHRRGYFNRGKNEYFG